MMHFCLKFVNAHLSFPVWGKGRREREGEEEQERKCESVCHVSASHSHTYMQTHYFCISYKKQFPFFSSTLASMLFVSCSS